MKEAQEPSKGTVLLRNDQKCESLREDINRIYMTENSTLLKTTGPTEEQHSSKASPRKWKDKLKEWGYEKHLSQSEMKIIVAKEKKSLREEGKATVFLHNGIELPTKKMKIEIFKKRKIFRESDPVSPSASTPTAVTYFSPRDDAINDESGDDLKHLLSSTLVQQSEKHSTDKDYAFEEGQDEFKSILTGYLSVARRHKSDSKATSSTYNMLWSIRHNLPFILLELLNDSKVAIDSDLDGEAHSDIGTSQPSPEGGSTSSSMSSHKYGITLSDSDFPGYNLSRHAVE